MNSFEAPGAPSLEDRCRAFAMLSHDEDWEGTVRAGIPLYEELVEKDDERAEEVRTVLKRLLLVMENSGAGPSEEKESLAQKIRAAIT